MAIALADARRRAGGDGSAGAAPADSGGGSASAAPAGSGDGSASDRGQPSGEPLREDGGDGGPGATAVQLHRLATSQLELAMQTLRNAGPHDLEPAVHDARKAIKRVRSTLRLLGAEPAPDSRQRARAALRDASQALMQARDAAVAPRALRRIVRREEERLGVSIGAVRLRTLLLAAEAETGRALLAAGGGRDLALRRLADAHAELSMDAISRTPQAAVAAQASTRAEMQRIYRRGRRQMRRAARKGEPAQMHLWRKRVKDLRYAAEALAVHGPPSARRSMRRTARAADALGEVLGDEHDLAMLAERVSAERELFAHDRAGRKALSKAIERRRRKLRRRALRDGRTLYRQPPKRFSRPLAGRRG